MADALDDNHIPYEYEAKTLYYTVPERVARYTPDFVLANGVIVEAKGEWTTEDRQKHRLLKLQYPDLDIRIVFSNSSQTIGKKSSTTYGMYCERLGIPYADKTVPIEWWKGTTTVKANVKRLAALKLASSKPS